MQAIALDVADDLAPRRFVGLGGVAFAQTNLVQMPAAVVQVVERAFDAVLSGERGQDGLGDGCAQARNHQQAQRDDGEEVAAHGGNYGGGVRSLKESWPRMLLADFSMFCI